MSVLMNIKQNVKTGTVIIIAITIVLTIIFVVTNERKNETNEYSAGHYILFAIVTFAIVTFLALKTEMSAIYTMKCIHGTNYRKTLSNSEHLWYRVLHVIPFFAGDLTNVVLFHTCTRE